MTGLGESLCHRETAASLQNCLKNKALVTLDVARQRANDVLAWQICGEPGRRSRLRGFDRGSAGLGRYDALTQAHSQQPRRQRNRWCRQVSGRFAIDHARPARDCERQRYRRNQLWREFPLPLRRQRMVETSGTYDADGTQDRTEVDSFSRIISHGTAGNGPAWFEARTKTGGHGVRQYDGLPHSRSGLDDGSVLGGRRGVRHQDQLFSLTEDGRAVCRSGLEGSWLERGHRTAPGCKE